MFVLPYINFIIYIVSNFINPQSYHLLSDEEL
nr:MAG TPA: hypothetical protein [Caudoviricetes sp.]